MEADFNFRAGRKLEPKCYNNPMDTEEVIKELSNKYPGKKIIKIPEDNPTEIICEISPGIVISVIDKSESHYHKEMTETYEILKGSLDVYKDGDKQILVTGDRIVIEPGVVHYAIGDETWIKVIANPPWTPEDHILME